MQDEEDCCAELTALRLNHINLQIECNRLRQLNKHLVPESTNELIHLLENEIEILKIKSDINVVIYPSVIAITLILGIAGVYFGSNC
jgi:hypothetical protein